MGILEGKKALILGVANDRSIAWGIAKEYANHGAKVALSYLNDALKKRVEPLAQEIGADFTFEMDVTNEDHYAQMYKTVEEKWGKFDILVHSLAFADKGDLKVRFVETSRKGFETACTISAWSLLGVTNSLKTLLNENGSVISMTYHGSQQVVNNYNVMGVAKAALESTSRYLAEDLGKDGVRVNCISSGPIKTLAASGISGLRGFLQTVEEKAPMRKNVTPEDVAGAAVYLGSDLSKCVSGQILYVDSGMSIIGC